jgi:peptidoglycan/LPS O-acetylase OafA/YrhL
MYETHNKFDNKSTLHDELKKRFKCSLIKIISDEWLTAFSLNKNFKALVSMEPNKNDIPILHGIKFINMLVIFYGHLYVTQQFKPIMNRNEMTFIFRQPWTIVLRAGFLNTDVFIMLSGMLATYSFFEKLQRGQKINVTKAIVFRYFRIVIPMTVMIIFITFIMPLLGDGPQWNMMIKNQSEICKTTWWKNILLIQNWLGIENMCKSHTHHIASDFQLSVIAQFLVILLYKRPKIGSVVIFSLATASTIGNFYVTYNGELTLFAVFGLT